MDKALFIEKAPYYYALAIAVFLNNTTEEYVTLTSIEAHYWERDFDANDGSGYDYLESGATLTKAIHLLNEVGMIVIRKKAFGPEIFRKSDKFDEVWKDFEHDDDSPFKDYQLLSTTDGNVWLRRTLREVNVEARRLLVDSRDYEDPELDWEPIPLDRDNIKLTEAKLSLQKAIEEVRTNNGYSATYPKERAFVLETLEEGARQLENDSTTRHSIRKYLLEPLSIVMVRGRSAALGIAAQVARQEIVSWLMDVTHKIVGSLFFG